MSAPVKFRAWDSLEKRFTTSENENQGHYTLSLDGSFLNLQNGSGDDEYAIQAFIGLLDINGKEIYGGDIVRFIPLIPTETSGYAVVDWEGNLETVKSPRWGLRFISQNKGFSDNMRGILEIVGNVFETSFDKINALAPTPS